MKHYIVVLASAMVLALTGCSAINQSEYVWVTDYEQMQLVEEANRMSALPNKLHWVNPPMKRIHRSELAQRQQQHQQPAHQQQP